MPEAQALAPQDIFQRVANQVGDAAFGYTTEGTKDPYFKVKPDAWPQVGKLLKESPELYFDFLNCITAVDWIKQNLIQMVYHLYSYRHHHSIVVKIDLPRAQPQLPSVARIWRSADWQEREQFDLLGVEFIGHPELKRILMPDDWVGHPMRKDYKEAARYRDMPTTRPSTFDLLAAFDKSQSGPRGEGGE